MLIAGQLFRFNDRIGLFVFEYRTHSVAFFRVFGTSEILSRPWLSFRIHLVQLNTIKL